MSAEEIFLECLLFIFDTVIVQYIVASGLIRCQLCINELGYSSFFPFFLDDINCLFSTPGHFDFKPLDI